MIFIYFVRIKQRRMGRIVDFYFQGGRIGFPAGSMLYWRKDMASCFPAPWRTWQERRLLALGYALKLGRCKEIRR